MVESGTVPQMMASTTAHKINLAVCCAIIFQSKQDDIPAIWTTGINHSAQPIISADGKEIELEVNFVEVKNYPYGPKCKFNRKVDCLAFGS